MTNNVDFLKPIQVYSFGNDTWSDAEVKVVTCNRVVFKRGDMEEVLPIDSDLFRNKKESRAVPKDKWLDLTKPLEGVYNEGTFEARLVGGLDPDSRNFPSWFVIEDGSCVMQDRYFLMRGDGKTDIPGLTVRNKAEGFEHKEVASKLKLPLEVGKKYRTGEGMVVTVQDINDPFEHYGSVKTDYVYYHRDGTFAEGRNPFANIVEGPLA